MLTNAHVHFKETFSAADFCGQTVCFCAGSAEEWKRAAEFTRVLNSADIGTCVVGGGSASGEGRALVSAGLHPWSLVPGSVDATGGAANVDAQLSWLTELLAHNAADVAAVGECGIDLYTPELKAALPAQLHAFEKQMELAARYEKPLVIHCRRSIQYFFEYAPRLQKLPSVIFHAYPGTLAECESLLWRGINAYFSFGGSFAQKVNALKNGEHPEVHGAQKMQTVVIRGGKHAAECVAQLPADRLLLETDAAESAAELLPAVFRAAAKLRGGSVSELEAVCGENFRRAYGL
jgi:TatD DNase family protein